MSSKTKIVVLHLKEIIYTGIFALLGILFIVLLIIMFLPDKNDVGDEETSQSISESEDTVSYVPGVYTTCIALGEQSLDIEVTVDETTIKSIEIVNLSEEITTMYPLVNPTFQDIRSQIIEKQSLEDIVYEEENKYTSLVLLNAITNSLDKALCIQ